MFIYEFMAGLVPLAISESFTGPPEEYDPHKHRKISKPTTYAETMIHSLKAIFGAGVLAMPDAIRRTGIIAGVAFTLFLGVFATYCVQVLIIAQYEVCKKHRRGYMGYPKTMKLAVMNGPKYLHWLAPILSNGVNVMLVIWQIGVGAVYLVFVGEQVEQIAVHYGYNAVTLRMVILCTLPINFLFSLVKELKHLTHLSTLANIATIAGLLLVFFYLIEDDVVVTSDTYRMKSAQDIPIYIGITLFAIEAVGVIGLGLSSAALRLRGALAIECFVISHFCVQILALEYNMEKPKEFIGLFGLFSVCMTIIVISFTAVGIFGYLKYGDSTAGVVTLNLPSSEKKAQSAKLFIALALFLSYPLQNYVAWQIITRAAVKRFQPKNHKKVDYCVRVIIALIPYIFALIAPSLGAFIALMGALTLSLLAIVFPGIMDFCIHYPDRLGIGHWKVYMDIFIVVFGLICMLSGVYSSVLEMYEKY